MPVNPPAPWPHFQPVNWNAMSTPEIKEKLDGIENRIAGHEDEIRHNDENLIALEKRNGINNKVFIGGIAGFAGGMLTRILLPSPIVLGIGIAGAVTYISAMIYKNRLQDKMSDLRQKNDELRHQINLSEIWKKAAHEKYDARIKIEEQKNQKSRDDFMDLAAGLVTQEDEQAGILNEEGFIRIDDIKLDKYQRPL